MLARKNVAQDWLGKTVVDRDGATLGVCTQAVTGPPAPGWIGAEAEGTARYVPASGAVLSRGVLHVPVTRAEVESAPTAGTTGVITPQEGEALSQHYGISSAGSTEPITSDRNGSDRLVVTVTGLVGLAALVGVAVRVLALRRRRREQPPSPLARLARLVAGGSAVASSALLPRLRTGAQVTARVAARAGDLGATAATHGARGAAEAAEAARAGLVPVATTAAALTTKGASAAVGTLGEVGKTGLHGALVARGAVASVPETVAEQGHELHEQWRKAVRTVKFVLALAAGYVLGARDGRERFEQLKRAATDVAQRPEVQDAKDRLTKAGERKLARGQQGQPGSSSQAAGPVDGAPATTSTPEARRNT